MQEGLQKHSIKYLPAEEDCSENFFSTFQLFKEKRGFRRPEPSLGRVRRALSGEPIRRNAIHSLIHPHHIWLITSILLNHEMRTRAISDESPKDIETQFDLSSIRVMELRAWFAEIKFGEVSLKGFCRAVCVWITHYKREQWATSYNRSQGVVNTPSRHQ